MTLTADRNTPSRDGKQIAPPVAASTEIFAGSIVCADANGYATPGAAGTGLTYLGRAEDYVNNSDGADGDVTVPVNRGRAFKWANSSSDPIGQSALGQTCYIEDDETVAATSSTDTLSAAGIVIGIEDDGVWVE